MDLESFSELVGAIYDAAIDRDLWPHALKRVCELHNFRKATLDLNHVPSMTNLVSFHYGVNDRQAASMVSHYRNMPAVWGGVSDMLTRPIDRPWIVSRIMDQNGLRETEYYKHWVAPMGLVDGAALVLSRDSTLFGSLRLATDERRGFIDDTLFGDLCKLLPHCQRAARISGILDLANETKKSFEVLVEAVAVPIIFLSKKCCVVYANFEGRKLLDDASIVGIRAGLLVSPFPDLLRAIELAVHHCSRGEEAIPGAGQGVPLIMAGSATRAVHFLPLSTSGARSSVGDGAVTAVLFSTNSALPSSSAGSLQSTFELTAAEMKVLAAVLAGYSTRATASSLGVAESTVRTHVLHIFEKTSTHCRADLIRLATTLTSPIRPS